jgi:hypothetical protein
VYLRSNRSDRTELRDLFDSGTDPFNYVIPSSCMGRGTTCVEDADP